MASKTEIVDAIASVGHPVSSAEVAKLLHLTSSAQLGPQIERLVKDGLITRDENKQITLTDEGREDVERRANLAPGAMPSEEAAGATPYQQFFHIGASVGIERELAGLTARHVWQGGNYRDMKWVWQALMEMQIRPDLATRWFNAWRSQLGEGTPPEVAEKMSLKTTTLEPGERGDRGDKGDSKGFTHIIDEDGLPRFVGEGRGDMRYDDCVRLSETKMVRSRAPAAAGGEVAPTPGTFAEEMVKILKAAQELGGGERGKSYLVSENEAGNVEVKEIEGDEPVVVPSKGAPAKAPTSYLLRESGEVEELDPGKPVVVIHQEAAKAPPGGGKTWFLNDAGKLQELEPGQPIVVYRDRPGGDGDNRPILQMQAPDGTPLKIDMASYFQLEDHKAKMLRDKETHDVKMEVAKGVKDIVEKFGRAAAKLEED